MKNKDEEEKHSQSDEDDDEDMDEMADQIQDLGNVQDGIGSMNIGNQATAKMPNNPQG